MSTIEGTLVDTQMFIDGVGEERFNEVMECKDLQELIKVDASLVDDDIQWLRKASRFLTEKEDLDLVSMLEDFKYGLLFIDVIYGEIKKRNSDHEERPDQIRGSKLMYMSSYFKSNFIGEYPTGSGKSFMYLIFAAASHAIRTHKSIVSTAGIALQEQLKGKDIPFIANVFTTITGKQLPYVILKGRQNYSCTKKMNVVKKAIAVGADVAGVTDMAGLKSYMTLIPKNFSGDMSDIDITPSYDIRNALTCKNSREMNCKGCEFKSNDCPFYRVRALTERSPIVVINYHVLMTEIENIQMLGKITGGVADNYIFDEAHEIAKISRDFSHRKINVNTFASIKGMFTSLDNVIDDNAHPKSRIAMNTWSDVGNIIDEMKTNFSVNILAFHRSSMGSKKGVGFSTNMLDHDEVAPIEWMKTGLSYLKGLILDYMDIVCDYTGFQSAEALFSVAMETPEEDMSASMMAALPIINECMHAVDELISLQVTVDLFCSPRTHDGFVLWTDTDDEERVSLNFKMVVVDSIARAIFNTPYSSSVSVSATLSTGGTFDLYKTENTIAPSSTSFEIIGESPFDLRNQELWYVPRNAISAKGSSGAGAVAYDKYVAENIVEIIKATGGGVLVLFTSIRSMKEAYNYALRELPNYHIYAQKELPNKILVQHFTSNRDSVLFATRSFFTGIDVKGASLRCVILDKLPFDNISDPVIRVLSSKDNGFKRYTVPFMLTTLKQIIGRGIRSKTDKCVISVLDARLITTFRPSVAKTFFFGASPPRRTMNIEHVKHFNAEFIKDDVDDDDDVPF